MYMKLSPSYHFCGFFLTLSLVDAIYYLTEAKDGPIECLSPSQVQTVMMEGGDLLRLLAQTSSIAARAYKALEGVLLLRQESLPRESVLCHSRKDNSANVQTVDGINASRAPIPDGTKDKAPGTCRDTPQECSSTSIPLDVNSSNDDIFRSSPSYHFRPMPPQKHPSISNETTNGNGAAIAKPTTFIFEGFNQMESNTDLDWGFFGDENSNSGFLDQDFLFSSVGLL